MFNKEINFISDFSLNKVKKFGSFVTFEKIITTDIHPAIKQYISAELDYLIFLDRNKLLHESSFDYSGQEVTKYFNLIGQEIKQSKRISFEDIRELISQAISFNINFLIRPKWALSKLIFENANEHTVQEVMMMLNHIYYYDYLRDILGEYLEKRKVIIINLTEFELILNKLDRELFSAGANSLLENVLVSIAEFFNEGGVNKSKISPVSIETFLKEKNLMDNLVTLRKSIAAEDRQKYDISDLKKILFTYPATSVETKTYDAAAEQEHGLEEIGDDGDHILAEIEDEGHIIQDGSTPSALEPVSSFSDDLANDVETTLAADENTLKPATEIMQESEEELLSFYEAEIKALDEDGLFNGIDEEPAKESADAIKSEVPLSEKISADIHFEVNKDAGFDSGNESDFIQYEKIEFEEEIFTVDGDQQSELNVPEKEAEKQYEETETAPQNPVTSQETTSSENVVVEKELFSFMSDKEMERIVGAIFNDDREDFVTTIERISECKNYNEATEILKGVYFSYKVSPFSKEAVALTNIVSSYFHQS